MRGTFTRVSFLLTLLLACGAARGLAEPTHPVAADALLQHVRYLASDELEGRGTGDPGGKKAAEYIAGQFRLAGLQPAGDGGTFLQEFPARVSSSLGPDNTVAIPLNDGGERTLTLKTDFIPFAFSNTGQCSGPVVFAGYGITAAEFHYDDYEGLDVKGKVVLVLRHEPADNDTASLFDGRRTTRHSEFRTKARNAETHGAVGILIVNGPGNYKPGEDDLVPWSPAGGGSQQVGIPAMQIRRDQVAAFWGEGLAGKPVSLEAAQAEIDRSMKPQSFVVTARPVTIHSEINASLKPTANVVGWLPPTATPAADSRPAESHLIIGAHYDHLGMGGHSSLQPDTVAVHNGADDNASGTSGVIELARAIASDPAPRTRGIVFVAFSGEELGLYGSAWYADHPAKPLDQAVVMINMDMIGRLKNRRLQIGGIGSSPGFKALLERAYPDTNTIKPVFSESGSGPSDHSTFYAKKRPVLFFFTGVHEDYHRPSDDWPKINAPGMAQVVDGVRRVAMELATGVADVPFVMVAADTTRPVSSGGGGYGAYLGTIPDMSYEDGGVKLSGVRAGSPAEKAGLREADIIVGFDGRPVRNLYDMTDELRSHRAGDAITLTVKRGAEEVKLPAVLGKRS